MICLVFRATCPKGKNGTRLNVGLSPGRNIRTHSKTVEIFTDVAVGTGTAWSKVALRWVFFLILIAVPFATWFFLVQVAF